MKPDVGQRPEEGSEVPSSVGTEKTRDVLDQNVSAGPNKLVCDSGEFEEEGGSLAGEPGALPRDGEVLAGESADEEINTAAYPCPGFPPPLVSWRAVSVRRTSARWFSERLNTATAWWLSLSSVNIGPSFLIPSPTSGPPLIFRPTASMAHVSHVVVDSDAGESGGENGASPGVGLAEEGGAVSGAVESGVESPDPGKEGSIGERIHASASTISARAYSSSAIASASLSSVTWSADS